MAARALVPTSSAPRCPAIQRRSVVASAHRDGPRFLGEWDTRTPHHHPDVSTSAAAPGTAAFPASDSHAARWLMTGYQCVGQRPDLWRHVGDVMSTSRAFTTRATSLGAAAVQVAHAGGLLPVVDDDGLLVGLLSQRDCRKAGDCVGDVMGEAVAVREGDAIRTAAALMLEKGLERLPVVNGAGACVGWLGRSELFWALAEDSDAVRPH